MRKMVRRTLLVMLLQYMVVAGSGTFAATMKVMIIGVDGMRPDQMQLANTPNIDALIANGSVSLIGQNVGPSWSGSSGPNWASLLTGVDPGGHGITGNFDGSHNIDDDNFSTGDVRTLFGHAKQHSASIEVGLFNAWSGIGLGTNTITEFSQTVVDYQAGGSDAATKDAAVAALLSQGVYATADLDLTFVHFDQVDGAGHANSYSSSSYRSAIENVDDLIGDLVAAVNSRVTFASEDWLYIISSDHGGQTSSGSHGDNSDPFVRTIPYIVSGNSALQGADLGSPRIWDVTPTALAHLGVDTNTLNLDGGSVGLAVDTSAVPEPCSLILLVAGVSVFTLSHLRRRGTRGRRP